MSIIHAMEGHKLRTVLVFASSEACLAAIRACVAEYRQSHLELALLESGTGLSMRRRPTPDLGERLFAGQAWPEHVGGFRSSAGTDPTLLASAARLVWVWDAARPFPPAPETGDHACATNVALGVRLGMPLQCYDVSGHAIGSPLTGAVGRFAHDALDAWLAERLALTERVRRDGIILDLDAYAPAMSTREGRVRPGNLALPAALVWRLRRLEMCYASHCDGDATSCEDESLAEEQAIEVELQACAEALRRRLGTAVSVHKR